MSFSHIAYLLRSSDFCLICLCFLNLKLTVLSEITPLCSCWKILHKFYSLLWSGSIIVCICFLRRTFNIKDTKWFRNLPTLPHPSSPSTFPPAMQSSCFLLFDIDFTSKIHLPVFLNSLGIWEKRVVFLGCQVLFVFFCFCVPLLSQNNCSWKKFARLQNI